MKRLTDTCWRHFDPWENCGQDNYCKRKCYEEGGCLNRCIVPKVYSRLAAYEDTGLSPEQVRELAAPPNPPLTLEELREMDGEPVWVAPVDGGPYAWMLIDTEYEVLRGAHGELAVFENYGKTWLLAYRRKPGEGTR